MMYSHDETVNAVLRFYQEITRHPYLNSNALVVPPANGWDSVNIQGKNDTVLSLLRHLPYLRSENPYEQLAVHWETAPICYLDDDNSHEDIYPLPAHCVYLTRSVDHEGTNLILDTERGTLTEFSHAGSHIAVPYEEYAALPEAEKWRAHRTSSITGLLDAWARRYNKLVWMLAPNPIGRPTTGRFYSRAASRAAEEELLRQEQSGPWRSADDEIIDDSNEKNYSNGSELDKAQQREMREEGREHVVRVYNAYLRHGWPDHFEKQRCRAELLELEKRRDADERRRMDEANPDAALFD